jgi:hypothetical protein
MMTARVVTRSAFGPGADGPPPRGRAAQVRVVGDLAAPGAALLAARLDELLEALEVLAHLAAGEADGVGGLLREALGLGVHHDHDLGLVVGQLVEVDDPRVLRAVRRGPRDPRVGDLLRDDRVELLRVARGGDLPVEVGVVDLRDLVDRLHEGGELLELGPLVVRGRDRHLDLDRLLDLRHGEHLPFGFVLC